VDDSSRFWERAEQVERFASREADRRLLKLLSAYPNPKEIRVLDLGCAGGRNVVVLAERGFDVFAIDASCAMVERTRERVAAVLGRSEAVRRVRQGFMDDLSEFGAATFQLVVALGIYHSARKRAEWDRALAETVRVLAYGGQLLVSNFSPASNPTGAGLQRVSGERNVYSGFDAGPMFLLGAAALDAEMIRHGLETVAATETVVADTESGQRVTVNAHYRKARR
jgi:SAM-dependent methyltransferase